MLEIELSPTARRDLVEILDWTREHFGIVAQRRYRLLIKRTLEAGGVEADYLTELRASVGYEEMAAQKRTDAFRFFNYRSDPGPTPVRPEWRLRPLSAQHI